MQMNTPDPAILTAAVSLLRPYAPDLTPEALQSALEQYNEPAPAIAGLRASERPLTRRQAAEYLNMSLATVSRYLKSGKLKRIVLSPRNVRVTAASVRALIAAPSTDVGE